LERMPTISIVTPSYNQAAFLEATIESVLRQDYPNIEYIVVDGGSTDDSVKIIRRYEKYLAWWCSEKDKGQSDAINKGWQMARGEIISYLNSDDLLLPGAINLIIDAYRSDHEASIYYGDWTYIDKDGVEIGRKKSSHCDFKKLLVLGQGKFIAQAASFYRADLVRQVGLIDETLHLSMDYDLLLRLSRQAKMIYIPQPLAQIRLHSLSKSSTFVQKHYQESIKLQVKYGAGLLTLWTIFKYFRYNLFSQMPKPVQKWFREMRGSVTDRAA
jgi:glycosyltransferase involved in cell wall biosynthesis